MQLDHGRCSLRALTANDGARDKPATGVAVGAAVVHAVPGEISEGAGASQELDGPGVSEAVIGEGDEDVLDSVEGAAAVLAGVDGPYLQVASPGRVERR